MIINGVNFNVELVKAMKKKAFIDAHAKVLFLNKDIEERKLLLGKIYEEIKKS